MPMGLCNRLALATLLVLSSAPRSQAVAQTIRPQPAPDTTARLSFDPSAVTVTAAGDGGFSLENLISRLGDEEDADARTEVLTAFSEAARFARDHLPELERALTLFGEAPELVQVALASDDENRAAPFRHAVVAAIALTAGDLKRLMTAMDAEDTLAVREDARFIVARLSAPAGRIIMGLFADGTIRQSLDQGGSNGSGGGSAGTGSLGFGVAFPNGWRVSSSLAVASSIDTVATLHGSTVLIPGSGRGALSNVLLDVSSPPFLRLGRIKLGLRGYFFGTNSTWRVDSIEVDQTAGTADTTAISDDIAILGGGLGLQWELLPGRRLLSQQVGLTFNAGVAARWIRGNGQDREALLSGALGGSTATSYYGLEGGLRADFGLIAAQAQYYFIFKRGADDHPIRGLSRGQLVIAFSVQGPVIQGPLD